MSRKNRVNRRSFIKRSAAAGGAALCGPLFLSFKARAGLPPSRIKIAHLSETGLPGTRISPSWKKGLLLERKEGILKDVLEQCISPSPRLDVVIFGGRLAPLSTLLSDPGEQGESVSGISEWLAKELLHSSAPGKGESGSLTKEPFMDLTEQHGFRILAIRPARRFGPIAGQDEDGGPDLSLVEHILSREPKKPAILAVQAGLFRRRNPVFPGAWSDKLLELVKRRPEVVLVLDGGAERNEAFFLESGALFVGTGPLFCYPMAGRLIEVEVSEGGEVRLSSRFVQTRLLDLLEESFNRAGPPRLLSALGQREERSFQADRKTKELTPLPAGSMHSALAPFWKPADTFNLAVFSDTHLSLDRFASEKERSDYDLVGHFGEEGSQALLDDLLAQAAQGRHRVEFYDRVFAENPESDENYAEIPLDGILFCGDLIEHGKKEEALLFRKRLENLPPALRERTLVLPGNHDMYRDFSPQGPKSSRAWIADFFKDFGPRKGMTNYVVEFTEWLALVGLDSTIPGRTPMGMGQDQLDWLEDTLKGLQGKAVMTACHHPPYKLWLVPELMVAYLRTRSHFTPKRSATRLLLQQLFAQHKNLKIALSGHYHGVAVDQFKKLDPAGPLPDDGWTTHIQVPCTIEYPAAYRILKFKREGRRITVEYLNAYTRLFELRDRSRNATIFKILGTKVRVPGRYEKKRETLDEELKSAGLYFRVDPYDLADLNVRGFKDGTARGGKGNTGKPNIAGKLEFSI